MSFKLIIDDRERSTFDDIKQVFGDKYEYQITRLEVGDYAITYNGVIILIIERKTWVDLAASIRDGRKQNVTKLINLRNRTQCDVAYLIEGRAFPGSNAVFSRIPYTSLRAHLDHLAFRDNIHMLYCKDINGTANRLYELIKNYSTITDFLDQKYINDVVGGAETETEVDVEAEVETENEIEADVDNVEVETKLESATEKATESATESKYSNLHSKPHSKPHSKSNEHELKVKLPSTKDTQSDMLRCIPGIGYETVEILQKKISIKDLYSGNCDVTDIIYTKYPNGKIIGDKKVKKILNAFKENNFKKIFPKILSKIPKVSIKTAKIICDKIDIDDLIKGVIDIAVFRETLLPFVKISNIACENIFTNILFIHQK